MTMVAMLLVVPVANAVTINVSTAADEYNSSPATCSLREAITAAQTNATFGGCAAGAGADEIALPADTYKITRAGSEENANVTGDFDVVGTDALTLRPENDQAKVVVDGNALDRVYDQQGNSSLSINSQQIMNGQLTAIEDGGGIRNSTGTLTVQGSTISGNRTNYQGGGIADYNNVTIVNSTLSGNEANGSGGGVYIPGGAVFNSKSSTLTKNVADAELNGNGEGGGFADGGATSINLLNTINAANIAPAGKGPDCDSDPFYFPRYTMQVQPFSVGNCLTGFNPPTNKVVTDPLLAPLTDNGGQTPTHALLEGSPAIGAGAAGDVPADACPATDQNGRARPAGACDIGAVQYYEEPPPPEPTFAVKFTSIKPKPLKLKRGKKAKAVSVKVTSTGTGAATAVKVCVQPGKKAKKAIKKVGKFCKTVGTLGASKTVKFKFRARKKAKKKLFKLKVVMTSTNAAQKTSAIKIRIK
ncbi:MAG: choice-of-anchor Q domain-containing protein [Solirubrobacterales bacterium]